MTIGTYKLTDEPAIAHVARSSAGVIDDQALAHIEGVTQSWQDGSTLDAASRHLIKLTMPQLMRELLQRRDAMARMGLEGPMDVIRVAAE